jgi:hypothetical protein
MIKKLSGHNKKNNLPLEWRNFGEKQHRGLSSLNKSYCLTQAKISMFYVTKNAAACAVKPTIHNKIFDQSTA